MRVERAARGLDSGLLLRALVAVVVIEHVLFVLAPLDVLDPVDPWRVGRLLLHGNLPYRDFPFEYPPLAALAFVLPGLVPHALAPPVLALQAVAAEVAVVVLVLRPMGRDVLIRYGVLSLLVFPFLSGGFDALPMAAIAISTWLLADGQAGGWWVAAAGTLAKLSPAAAWVWCRSAWRTALAALAVTAVVAALPVLLAPRVDDSYVGYSLHRGVQMESVAASTTWLADKVAGRDSTFAYRFRSWEIDGADGAALLWLVAAGAGLALVFLRSRRTSRRKPAVLSSRTPWEACLAVVLLMLVGSKVFSPQFVAWAAPVAAVVGGWRFRGYVVVAALTFAVYSVGGTGTGFLSLVLARNVALVGLTIAVVAQVVDPRPRPLDLPDQVVQ